MLRDAARRAVHGRVSTRGATWRRATSWPAPCSRCARRRGGRSCSTRRRSRTSRRGFRRRGNRVATFATDVASSTTSSLVSSRTWSTGAGHDVARRQVGPRVEPVHEPLDPGVEEHRALAAERLRQQPGRRRRARRAPAGGMDELEVGDRGAASHASAKPSPAAGRGRSAGRRSRSRRRRPRPPDRRRSARRPPPEHRERLRRGARWPAARARTRKRAAVTLRPLRRKRCSRSPDRSPPAWCTRRGAVPAFERRGVALVEEHTHRVRSATPPGPRVRISTARGSQSPARRRSCHRRAARGVASATDGGDPALRPRSGGPASASGATTVTAPGRGMQGAPQPGRAGADHDCLVSGAEEVLSGTVQRRARTRSSARRRRGPDGMSSGTVDSNTPSAANAAGSRA